jgi:DNA mismatch endonuclease Vsr
MTDVFDKEKRSEIMSSVRSKNTKPEIIVRKLLHSMGYRFRLYREDLPGTPDIALPKYKMVIFVHGCFWHGHGGCPRAKLPKTNVDFWKEKIEKNIGRDRENIKRLNALGWKPIVIWSCEVKNPNKLNVYAHSFLTRVYKERLIRFCPPMTKLLLIRIAVRRKSRGVFHDECQNDTRVL